MVQATQPEIRVVVSHERIVAQEPVDVSWTSTGLSELRLNGASKPLNGGERFTNLTSSTLFRVEGTDARGRSFSDEVRVLVDTALVEGSINLAPIPIRYSAVTPAATESPEDVVPGEFLVLFAEDWLVPASLSQASQPLSTTPNVHLLRTHELSHLALQNASDAQAALLSMPGVLAVTPNRYVQPASLNDEHVSLQWSLTGSTRASFDLAPLWSATEGSSDVVVAVIDTGIAADPNDPDQPHPDLNCGRMLTGASFLRTTDGSTSYTESAFETPGTRNAFHGTHVAGILGACTDNGEGVAGVDQASTLLPIRVFNDLGDGTLAEVLAAARWAAGLSVPGAPINTHPADVINLSLGTSGACNDTDHPVASVLASVTATGAILVAAAGNSGATNALVPANCPTVLSVGAVGPEGHVPTYSNRGPLVDVYAPGGHMTSSDRERGILSTYAEDDGTPAYAYMDGTSMAAPYVAGLISLLKALHPDLTGPQAKDMLLSASDLTSAPCRIAGRYEDCDALVVNPTILASTAVPEPNPVDQLFVGGVTTFGATSSVLTLTIQNAGQEAVTFESIETDSELIEATLFGSPVLTPGNTRSIRVDLDRTQLEATTTQGTWLANVTVTTTVGELVIPVRVPLGGTADVGPLTITVGVESAAIGGAVIRRTTTTAQHADDYAFTVDVDLSNLDLFTTDMLLVQVEGNDPPVCPGGTVSGEIRIPIRQLETLQLLDQRVPAALTCPSSPLEHPQ